MPAWSGDRDYQIKKLTGKPKPHIVAACSSTVPFVISRRFKFSTLDQHMCAVQTRWRQFLDVANKVFVEGTRVEGLEPVNTDKLWKMAATESKRVQYMRNCPPPFLSASSDTYIGRCCNRYRICPFCYMRTVADTCVDVYSSLKARKLHNNANYKLCYAINGIKLKESTQEYFAQRAYPLMVGWRRDRVKTLAPAGGLFSSSLLPSEDQLTLVVRQLFIVPKDWKHLSDSSFRVLGTTAGSSFITGLSRTLRYPAAVLNAPIRTAISTLNILDCSRFRLTEKFGLFRSEHGKEVVSVVGEQSGHMAGNSESSMQRQDARYQTDKAREVVVAQPR